MKLKNEKYEGYTIRFEKDTSDGWVVGGGGTMNKYDGKYPFYHEGKTKKEVFEKVKKQIDAHQNSQYNKHFRR